MSKFKLMLSMALAVGLTFAVAGMANAAAITCGGCHGTTGTQDPMPNNADNCTSNARALHGTHVNYSSTTFKKTVANYGKCAYCHKAVTTKAPTLTHNTGYINVTGYDSAGKATGLDYTAGTKTCTNACHKNPGSANPKWGNYTATTVGGIKLDCGSCHDDSAVNKFAGAAGKHNSHLLSNTTTPQGVLMSAAANAGCVNCHPSQATELWPSGKADDGTKKVYPHASDGTNVVADNATLQSQITAATKTGPTTTCVNACHPRTSAIAWNGALDCNMCHYWAASPLDTNNTGTGALDAGHTPHIKTGNQFTCVTCHPDRAGNTSHASRLPQDVTRMYNAVVTKAGMTWNANQSCTGSGTGCHGGGTTPIWGTTGNGCGTCHNYPGYANDWIAGNGHAVKYASTVATNTHMLANASFAYATDTLGAINDVTKCGKCHAGAAHNNGVINTAPSGYADCGGGNFTITTVTAGSNVTCSNVSCHSSKVTPNWY